MGGACCSPLALNWMVDSLSCRETRVEPIQRNFSRIQVMISDNFGLEVGSPVLEEGQVDVSMP